MLCSYKLPFWIDDSIGLSALVLIERVNNGKKLKSSVRIVSFGRANQILTYLRLCGEFSLTEPSLFTVYSQIWITEKIRPNTL